MTGTWGWSCVYTIITTMWGINYTDHHNYNPLKHYRPHTHNTETTQSIFVAPISSTSYTVNVIDDCLSQPISVTYTVDVPIIPPLTINETPDLEDICPYVPYLLESNVSGGTPPYNFNWFSNFETNLSFNDTYMATPSTTTTYTIYV